MCCITLFDEQITLVLSSQSMWYFMVVSPDTQLIISHTRPHLAYAKWCDCIYP